MSLWSWARMDSEHILIPLWFSFVRCFHRYAMPLFCSTMNASWMNMEFILLPMLIELEQANRENDSFGDIHKVADFHAINTWFRASSSFLCTVSRLIQNSLLVRWHVCVYETERCSPLPRLLQWIGMKWWASNQRIGWNWFSSTSAPSSLFADIIHGKSIRIQNRSWPPF